MEEADDVSSDGLLRVKWGCAASNIQRMWKGWFVRHLIKRIRAACIIQRTWGEWYVRSKISPDAFDALLMIYQYLNDISIPEVAIDSDGDNIISSSNAGETVAMMHQHLLRMSGVVFYQIHLGLDYPAVVD